MKRRPVSFPILRALIFGALVGAASAQTTFVWTGLGSGWQGQGTPPNNGTALLYLPDTINRTVGLPADLNIYGLYLADDDTYNISPTSGATLPLTLTLGSGALIGTNNVGTLKIDPNINLSLSGSPVFDDGSGTFVVTGHITGSVTTLNLTSSNTNSLGAFVFNNTGTGNTYTGSTLIAPTVAGGSVAVAFWNNSPFGTGAVTAVDSVALIAHGTQTVANAFTFSSTTAANVITAFRSWDAPLTLGGPFTLASNTTLQSQPTLHGTPSADNSGIFPTPGAPSRNPVIITGNIGQSGAHSLTVGGAGVLILQPATGLNTYTGGTNVNGSLVFGNNNAIPTGAGNVTVNASGYAGIGDTSVNNFGATLLAHINVASAGAVGVDTLPGNSTITYSNPIDLTGFTSTTIRIGTATSANLNGVISPKGQNYQFGNGGGSLYVQSNLNNVGGIPSQVQVNDGLNSGLVSPLKLYLQGTNTYTNGTLANNGFIIFDGANSLPASGQLTAGGSSAVTGASYVGYTDAVTALTPAAFLAKFNLPITWGIVGFDTHAGNATVNLATPVSLTSFNNGVFLGTATSAIVSGTLTPTADNILRLTAANGGMLTVNSTLAGGMGVLVGSPSAGDIHYSDGTVVIAPTTANTYTGGTTFDNAGSLTLMVGGTTPLGTGPLTVTDLSGGSTIGLQATTANYTLANSIVFQNAVPANYLNLFLTGANSLILTGAISGPGELDVVGTTATLSGDNSALTGDVGLLNGVLNLNHNNAAGTGTLNLNGLSDSVIFSGAATAPVLYGIKGDTGSLILGGGMVLTFDTSNINNKENFGGSIGAGGPVAASVVVTSTTGGNPLYLSGNSNYTGGTTITNHGGLGIGSNTALGTGPVTLNSPNATLALNQGVTLTNALNYTGGTLEGFGTFAPSNLTSITFDTGKLLVPGLAQSVGKFSAPGTLTLATNAVFSNGGEFGWILQDVSRSDGFSQVVINGNLDLTTLSTSGFLIGVATLDPLGNRGFANLTIGTPYTLAILQTTGTISGFNPANFGFVTAQFENGTMPASVFSVTADTNHLYVNFTAIPEPSTWMLLGTGASLLGLGALRRRRA